jgi:hypothetical protein
LLKVGVKKAKMMTGQGTAMKFRIPFVCVLGVAAWIFALPSHARSISVDEDTTCSQVVPPTGRLSVDVDLAGAREGNRAKSGLNFPVLACDAPPPDTMLTPLNYTSNAIYTWVDLSKAATDSSGLLGLETTNFPSNVTIVAMVEVFKLAAPGYFGDYEILFNYKTSRGSACDNVFKPIAPSFTWFGKRYVFNGAGGVGSPCDSKNDFLFGPHGELLGHNSAPSSPGGFALTFVLTKGLPPGWTEEHRRDATLE